MSGFDEREMEIQKKISTKKNGFDERKMEIQNFQLRIKQKIV